MSQSKCVGLFIIWQSSSVTHRTILLVIPSLPLLVPSYDISESENSPLNSITHCHIISRMIHGWDLLRMLNHAVDNGNSIPTHVDTNVWTFGDVLHTHVEL